VYHQRRHDLGKKTHTSDDPKTPKRTCEWSVSEVKQRYHVPCENMKWSSPVCNRGRHEREKEVHTLKASHRSKPVYGHFLKSA
jgi:hypothetical protein